MFHRRLAPIGVLLLITSCLLMCAPLMDITATSMPYQDATPEIVDKQAAAIAAAQHRLTVVGAIAGVLAVLGVAALIYARKQARSGKADNVVRRPATYE